MPAQYDARAPGPVGPAPRDLPVTSLSINDKMLLASPNP